LAVELQALWTRGASTLAGLARRCGDEATEHAALEASARASASFKARFWCNETQFPFDCISATPQGGDAWADPSIRPNAVIALAVAPDLFEPWQREAIVTRAQRELLTPRGIRSLSPSHRDYVGHFSSDPEERVSAFHQGTSWPYLLGFYVRSYLHTYGKDPERVRRLRQLVRTAVLPEIVLGQVAQVNDADEPHRARGCPAQAFSTAELLRSLLEDLAEDGA
jgi:glycogen debranching enzyme